MLVVFLLALSCCAASAVFSIGGGMRTRRRTMGMAQSRQMLNILGAGGSCSLSLTRSTESVASITSGAGDCSGSGAKSGPKPEKPSAVPAAAAGASSGAKSGAGRRQHSQAAADASGGRGPLSAPGHLPHRADEHSGPPRARHGAAAEHTCLRCAAPPSGRTPRLQLHPACMVSVPHQALSGYHSLKFCKRSVVSIVLIFSNASPMHS